MLAMGNAETRRFICALVGYIHLVDTNLIMNRLNELSMLSVTMHQVVQWLVYRKSVVRLHQNKLNFDSDSDSTEGNSCLQA